MLELVQLRFKGIGRFVDEQTIEVDALGNFVQLDGQNNNTKGSSGSGKSTVFNALDYLLGLNNLAATILQSRLTKENIWVYGKFLWDGEEIEMTRSKSMFQIKKGDDVKTKKDAEDLLAKIFGMPGDLFRKIIHKRQKEGGFFLEFGPKDMHDFLMDCINLSGFKSKYFTVDAKIKNLEAHRLGVENDIKIEQSGLTTAQDAILSLGLPPLKDMHEEVIADLKNKLEGSAVRFLGVKSRCEALVQEYVRNRPDTSNPQYDASAREDLERRRKEIEQKISKVLEMEQERQRSVRGQVSEKVQQRGAYLVKLDQGSRAKNDAAKIAAEIKSIRESTCPTCAQEWKTQSAVDVEQKKMSELMVLKKTIEDSTIAQQALSALDAEIEDLKVRTNPVYDPQLPDLNEELAEIVETILEDKRREKSLYDQQSDEMKKKLDTFVAGQAELQKKVDAAMEQARGQVDLDRRVHDSAVQKLQAYGQAKLRYDLTLAELNKKAEFFTKRLEKHNTDLEETVKEQFKADETKRALKMFISRSFDEALDAISDKATEIIRCIPNMSNATIQLEGTRETKEGVLKEEVNAVISSDGETGVPIKSLSGGERSALDLAVDLAVIDYIETKSGKGMNIFILDEPFTGLGTVEIEMALEVLKNANTKKKLIIVDHNPEVKQMVQTRLVVIRDGSTSKVA